MHFQPDLDVHYFFRLQQHAPESCPMNYPWLARVATDAGFGTGVLVSSTHVLTCAHVVSYFDPLKPRQEDLEEGWSPVSVFLPASGEFPERSSTGRILACSDLDLALVVLDEPTDRPTLTFYRSAQVILASADCGPQHVAGFEHPDSLEPAFAAVSGQIFSVSEALGTAPMSIQTKGGLPKGMSGSPLLASVRETAVGLGLVYLGGAASASSRGVGSAGILRFLGQFNIDAGFEGPLGAFEHLPFSGSMGSFIRARRARKMLTGPELAERIGVDEAALKGWEDGACLVPASALRGLTRELIHGDADAAEDWLRLCDIPDFLSRLRGIRSGNAACRIAQGLRSIVNSHRRRPGFEEDSDVVLHVYTPWPCKALFVNAGRLDSTERFYEPIDAGSLPRIIPSAGEHFLPPGGSLSVGGPPGTHCLILLGVALHVEHPWPEMNCGAQALDWSTATSHSLLDRLLALAPEDRLVTFFDYEVCARGTLGSRGAAAV